MMILESVVTCPHCGFKKQEKMPVDTCRIVYACGECGYIMRPKKGDCCIFCSFGSVNCPSKQ
ncbi:MAG: GDCCVxC domain-containing (seleno)protein [Spirochaetia bacterium]